MKMITPKSAINATVYTIIFIILVTIISSHFGLYSWFASFLWHHWVAKSILASMLWVFVAILPVKKFVFSNKFFLNLLIFSLLSINIFFIWHYYHIKP